MIKRCVTEVVGGYWGDEGKGRVASFESKDASLVLRTTGGNNAGHTVYYEGHKIPLHLIPGGIIYPGTKAVICPGVVVNPKVLLDEINLISKYVPVCPANFLLSDKAHIIMPYHIDIDAYQEKLRGSKSIGTTRRGIGPCYEDIARRIGLRFQDLFLRKKELLEKINIILSFHKSILKKSDVSYTANNLYDYCMDIKKDLKYFIGNSDDLICCALGSGKKIVIEGAQAEHLDNIHGDYPNCTSSQCNPSGTLSGAGIGPIYVDKVIVTIKAYCSRVGNGPFPTELFDKEAEVIRRLGHEYGTTTGRPRRCGWLDLVALNEIRGYTHICLNHLDTIGLIGKELGYIKVCTSYKIEDESAKMFSKKYASQVISYPSNIDHFKDILPIYREFEGGWDIPSRCKKFENLPNPAQEFVKCIEQTTGLPVSYIGIGPNNEDTIIR